MGLNFEIKVQRKGDSVGTLGWLNSLLADGELVIKNNRDGVPSLFFHQFHDAQGNKRSEKEGNMFIAKVVTKEEYYSSNLAQYKDDHLFGENLLLFVSPQSNQISSGFVDVPLTPAAFDKLDQFIYEAKEKYKEWWMNYND